MSKHKLPIGSMREKVRAIEWINRAPPGWTVEFKPPTRNLDQNKRLWAFIDDIADQKEWAGKKRDSESWKALFLAALRGQELVPNLDGNGFVALHMRSSELSPSEFSDLLALVEAWGAQNGVHFTDTDSPGSGSSSLEPGERASAASGAQGPAGARRNTTEDA